MTTDCSLNYKFHTWKFQAQNMGRTCYVLTEIVFDIQNNLCTQHVLPMFFKNKIFWQRFTCIGGQNRVGFDEPRPLRVFVKTSSNRTIPLTLEQNWTVGEIKGKDLYQVQETLKKLCEFSTVWADRAHLGSQKSFSKLTAVLPCKTHDNFQIKIQKITKMRKNWTPSFSNQKKDFGSS